MKKRSVPFLFLILLYLPQTSVSKTGQGFKFAAAAKPRDGTSEQLLEYDEMNHKVILQDTIFDHLANLQGPLHIVTAIGDARIGKSTAFNVIAAMLTTKEKKGKISSVPTVFSVCQSLETCTKGVWLHTMPLTRGGHLIMLDVEGTDLGSDMITTQFSLLTSALSSNVLVFLKESFPKRTGIFLHELARLKERMKAHMEKENNEQALYIIIRDPLKPPQDVSLKTYISQKLSDPSYCIDAVDECRLLETNFPLNRVNIYSLPYVSRRYQKSLEWTIKDKTYLRTMASLAFDLKASIEIPEASVTTGKVLTGIIDTFIQKLGSNQMYSKSGNLLSEIQDKGQASCIPHNTAESQTEEKSETTQQHPSHLQEEIGKETSLGDTTENLATDDVLNQDIVPTEIPGKVGSIDIEKIIKSPFETIGPGIYSYVMHDILRLKPTGPPSKEAEILEQDDESDDSDDEDLEEEKSCVEGETGCPIKKQPQDTVKRWGKAVREFIDDISDALDDFFVSITSE